MIFYLGNNQFRSPPRQHATGLESKLHPQHHSEAFPKFFAQSYFSYTVIQEKKAIKPYLDSPTIFNFFLFYPLNKPVLPVLQINKLTYFLLCLFNPALSCKEFYENNL